MRDGYADLGDVRLHYVESGASHGPLVVLLHGFPEFWYSWRNQIPALAAAGWRVLAPDLRGYNLSDRPAEVRAYRPAYLVRDIERLIAHCGAERASVVGHDWGGTIAWLLAMHRPRRVERLVVMNAPHPAAFLRGVLHPAQLWRSAYVVFFQLRWLPEAAIGAGRFALTRAALRAEPVRRGAFSGEDIERYIDALSRPGALSAGLNYYRALVRDTLLGRRPRLRRIEAPVMVVWGDRDRYLRRQLAEPDPAWVPHARVEHLPQASHWLQSDEPDRVNRLLIDFLAEARQ